MTREPFIQRVIVLIATGAYVGFVPRAPGTLGSLLGLLLLWPLGAGTAQLIVTLALVGVGIVVADRAARVLGGRDPHAIIIDEVVGIAVATALVPPRVPERAVAWILFRLFDITKPYPARRAEELSGGLGIVGDDVVAAVYANLVVHVWLMLS